MISFQEDLTSIKKIQPWYLIVLALLLLLIRTMRIGKRPAHFPPGPKTSPLVGNMLQIPNRGLHKQYQTWAQKYGPVFGLMLGPQPLVVLSSDVAVKEVLDRRSAATNERGEHYVGQEVLGGGEHMLLMPSGPKWRLQRKLMQKMLNISVARSYIPYTMLENQQMLFDLLQAPDEFIHIIKRYSHSVFTTITHGRRCSSHKDPTMRQFVSSVDELSEIMQSNSAAWPNIFPALRRLPDWMVPKVTRARTWHRTQTEFYLGLWNETKTKLHEGRAKPCFAVDVLLKQEKEGFTDKFGAFLCGAALEAGTDTTANELIGFVQAMVLFPEVQKKAQAELETVVGQRMPTIEDLDSLPYVRYCVKETLRWMPTAIMGAAPHAAKDDIQYQGYVIPKGTLLINNVYTIHRDGNRYTDPESFKPERYLGDNKCAAESAQSANGAERDHFTFGAGRRLCAGIHVAEQSLFLGIARILWTFDITPKMDLITKQPLLPDPERYTPAVVCMPEPFPATIKPRSTWRAEKVVAEWTEAQNLLDENGQWKVIGEGLKFTKV
ncbi:cytochrome P450 [Dendryphion nanum]|uniref:Cytochrome P450 n=1 Tax=Dendryphion nanum TaxID=256645 RepID=A0A9P9ITI0_9PLEO|nr:cytochrome P450 [Dendryphion nanum]